MKYFLYFISFVVLSFNAYCANNSKLVNDLLPKFNNSFYCINVPQKESLKDNKELTEYYNGYYGKTLCKGYSNSFYKLPLNYSSATANLLDDFENTSVVVNEEKYKNDIVFTKYKNNQGFICEKITAKEENIPEQYKKYVNKIMCKGIKKFPPIAENSNAIMDDLTNKAIMLEDNSNNK